jgi:hypothetical protein
MRTRAGAMREYGVKVDKEEITGRVREKVL